MGKMKDLVIGKDDIINELIDSLNTNKYSKALLNKCFNIITSNSLREFISDNGQSFEPEIVPILNAMHRTIGTTPSKSRERKARELYNLFINN